MSSDIDKDKELRGQEKVLAICEALGATHYVNAVGGKGLYSRKIFNEQGLQLPFLKSKPVEYSQFKDPFIANLSIIDVLMFNNQEQSQKLLGEYEFG